MKLAAAFRRRTLRNASGKKKDAFRQRLGYVRPPAPGFFEEERLDPAAASATSGPRGRAGAAQDMGTEAGRGERREAAGPVLPVASLGDQV